MLASMDDSDARSLLRHVKLQCTIRTEAEHLNVLELSVVPVLSHQQKESEHCDPTSTTSLGRMLDLSSVVTVMETLGYFSRSVGYVLRDQAHRFDRRQRMEVQAAAEKMLPLIEKEVATLAEWLGSLRRLREKSDLQHAMTCFAYEVLCQMPAGRIVFALRRTLNWLDEYQVLAQQFTGEQTSSNISEESRLALNIFVSRRATGRAIRMNVIREAGGEDPTVARAKYLQAVSFLGNRLKQRLREARTRLLGKGKDGRDMEEVIVHGVGMMIGGSGSHQRRHSSVM